VGTRVGKGVVTEGTGVSMMKVHSNEIHYFAQLIYANKKEKEITLQQLALLQDSSPGTFITQEPLCPHA
jgi:hypothetical protein